MVTGGIIYLNRGETEAIAKSTPTSSGSNTATLDTGGGQSNTATTLIPYSTTIGFVGDSLTYGCCNNSTPAPELEMDKLGSSYQAVNRGVNGSTTRDWVDDLLEPAMQEFRERKVEVVQVMLGTNDVGKGISTEQSIDNLRSIIGQLRDNGAKVIIVNKIPYSSKHNDLAIRQLNVALDELPNDDDVFLGDDQAYDYFREHQGQLYDGVHMDQDGYVELAELWADAFRRVVVEPGQLQCKLSADSYQRDSDISVTATVDKSPRWFTAGLTEQSGVIVDNKTISTGDYDVISSNDQTIIRFHADYLDGLSSGNHTIAIRFIDGVKVETELNTK